MKKPSGGWRFNTILILLISDGELRTFNFGLKTKDFMFAISAGIFPTEDCMMPT